ncbi:dTDP-fucosamine acetyltransferase [Clostridiales bacterium]|nr:dTDP-fucosamine acetyltransferase [Clostridiales bacterium]
MDNLIIRKAEYKDIDTVEKIYDDILDREESTGVVYTNWHKGLYPTRADAEKAFEAGTLYVGEIGSNVVACVNLNSIQPEEYSKINWSTEAEDNEVLVIHTLCISPKYAGKKIGNKFVDFAEELAENSGCKTIRIDTYEGNIPAASLYTKKGYAYTGSADFLFQGVIPERLKCFDKIIK